jgi:TusA-related sulfurtransferase
VARIDLFGSITPLTLLKVIRAYRSLASGARLEVRSDDPALADEMEKVLQRFPHTVESVCPEGDGYRIRIRKS